MRAVVMAGGEGTRLRPLTSHQPKPMMPLCNRPLMEHVLARLVAHDIRQVTVTVAFLARQVRTYFGDGTDFGVALRYAAEEVPLGTAGSVRNAAADLTETFLVVSGDVLFDLDLDAAVAAHRRSGALGTIVLRRVDNPVDFGIVITRDDTSIERFLEKPTWGQVFSDTINTGIYILEPAIFDFIPEGGPCDFASDVFPAALKRKELLCGVALDGYWEDVGTIDAYLRAHRDVLDGRLAVDVAGFHLGGGVWLGEAADVDPSAVIEGPAIIGDNCRVEAGARIGPHTVLGTDVVVKGGAELTQAVVHDHAHVGPGVILAGCVVGRSTDLREGARVGEGAVVGEECFVGSGAVVKPHVKVYPYKTVEPGAVVASSLVWESRGARNLFGRRGVRGLASVDITAELAVRLACAYGSTLPKGAVVCLSRDTSRVARSLKRALTAGFNLTGVHVADLELATVPLTRFQVRTQSAQGGVSVRLAPGDPASVEIRLFDADGTDVSEAAQRRIDRVLAREDFRRAFAGDIGDIAYPPRVIEYYTAALERAVDAPRVRGRGFKVVIDSSRGSTAVVLPSVLARTGADVLSLNPYPVTTEAAGDDTAGRVERVEGLVRASGSDLGVVFDADGEQLVLVDDLGRSFTPVEALMVLVTLIGASRPGGRVALPVAASAKVAELVGRSGAEVVWTKLASAHLMEAAKSGGVHFAAALDGGCIWPDFLPAFDAVATLAKLLDLLAGTGARLSVVRAGLPAVHVAHEMVPTPWERMGGVMRTTLERAKHQQVLLVDGVKVFHQEGWALVLPDPEEPLTHVWAEGASEEASERLAGEYARRISEGLEGRDHL